MTNGPREHAAEDREDEDNGYDFPHPRLPMPPTRRTFSELGGSSSSTSSSSSSSSSAVACKLSWVYLRSPVGNALDSLSSMSKWVFLLPRAHQKKFSCQLQKLKTARTDHHNESSNCLWYTLVVATMASKSSQKCEEMAIYRFVDRAFLIFYFFNLTFTYLVCFH